MKLKYTIKDSLSLYSDSLWKDKSTRSTNVSIWDTKEMLILDLKTKKKILVNAYCVLFPLGSWIIVDVGIPHF